MTSSEELFQRARALMPGGVNSPVRAFGSVGGTPPFMVSGRGPYLTDADGREYVDLVCSWGPALLGHAHPGVLAAVRFGAAHSPPAGLTIDVGLEPLQASAATPGAELWFATGPVHTGQWSDSAAAGPGQVRYAHDDHYLFAVVELDEGDEELVATPAA